MSQSTGTSRRVPGYRRAVRWSPCGKPRSEGAVSWSGRGFGPVAGPSWMRSACLDYTFHVNPWEFPCQCQSTPISHPPPVSNSPTTGPVPPPRNDRPTRVQRSGSLEEGPCANGRRGVTLNIFAEQPRSQRRCLWGVRRVGLTALRTLRSSVALAEVPKESTNHRSQDSNGYGNTPTRGRFQETHRGKDQQDNDKQQRDHECHPLNAPHKLLPGLQECHCFRVILVLRAARLAQSFFGQGQDPIRGARQYVVQFAQIGRCGQQVLMKLGWPVPLRLLRTVDFRYMGQGPFAFRVRQGRVCL